ncbi:hypothetical protein KR009_000959, partial [Drosophila setifemur]
VVVTLMIFGNQYLYGSAQLLDSDCHKVKTLHSRIVGGSDARLASAPWMAYIYNADKFFCGGSLISHCSISKGFHNNNNIYFILYRFVRLGEHDTTEDEDCDYKRCVTARDYYIDKKYSYPYYTSAAYYDVALGKLDRYVEYKRNIKPVCIATNPSAWQKYVDNLREMQVNGWGNTEDGQSSTILKKATLRQVDRQTCRRAYNYNIDQTQICLGNFQHYMAKGDSGGPAVSLISHQGRDRFYQFGIVSHAKNPFHGVVAFTNVLSYTPWIIQIVRREEPPPISQPHF